MSQSQISKFETGKKTPKLVDVERILRALDAPPELVTEVTALARIANTEWQDKRSSWRRGMEKRQTELASLESEYVERIPGREATTAPSLMRTSSFASITPRRTTHEP